MVGGMVKDLAVRPSRASRRSRVAYPLLLVALAITAALFASVASADISAGPTVGILGATGIGSPSELSDPHGVAVDDATGNVLVADTANNRVAVYSPGTGSDPGAYLTDFGSGSLSQPYGIAIDQVSHAVYVADAGNNRIVRFVSDGAATPTYALDPTFASPALAGPTPAAGEIGDFHAALAVDPTTRELVVADPASRLVDRYDDSGAFVSAFDPSDGQFVNPISVAVDADGVVYVAVRNDYPFAFGGDSRALRFEADGSPLGELAGVPAPDAVAVDRLTGNVVVSGAGNVTGDPESRLFFFADGVLVGSSYTVLSGSLNPIAFPPETTQSSATGVAVAGDAQGRIYATTAPDPTYLSGISSLSVFDRFTVPFVEVGATTDVTSTSLRFHGTVNPQGASTQYHFEYSADGSTWSSTPDADAGSGTADVEVSADVAGLAPNTGYELRLVVANPTLTLRTASSTQRTAVAPPSAVTTEPSDVSTTEAVLHASINAYGLPTTYHFEYGLTSDYGSRIPVAIDGLAGAGVQERDFSRKIADLVPGTTYHYRVVAQNAAGDTVGSDATFTTASGSESGRAYEQVSPVDKSATIVKQIYGLQARPDGEQIVYTTKGAFEDDSETSPFVPRYIGIRGLEQWSHRHLDPAQLSPFGVVGNLNKTTMAVSADLSRSIVLSNASLAPGGIAGGSNLYLQENATGARRLIAATANTRLFQRHTLGGNFGGFFLGGTADFETIYFESPVPLTEDAPTDDPGIYRWSAGELSLISKDGAGNPIPNVSSNEEYTHHPFTVSDDGRVVYVRSATAGVYRVVDGGNGLLISRSHRSGDDPTAPVGSILEGGSADGRYMFLRTSTPLVDGATDGVLSLYRYDGQTDDMELVAERVNNAQLGQSDDGRTIYFEKDYPDSTGATVMSWRDGVVRQIADLGGDTVLPFQAQSHNGRYLAFGSTAKLTQYDNRGGVCATLPYGGCVEIYWYDYEADQLKCASCPALGAPAAGNATGGSPQALPGGYWPRAVLEDGTLFLDTPEPLASRDVNGMSDVYEFDGTRARLVSAGTGATPAYFGDASSDGRDVFFTSAEQLVSQDVDNLTDLYDARVGGGLASQTPDLASAPCDGGRCNPGLAGPTDSPSMGSQAGDGSGGTSTRPRRRATVSIARATPAGNSLVVIVRASGRGRIRVAGARVRTTTRTVAKAGTYRVRVPLSRKAVAARRAHRRIKVRVVVSFTPPFGSAVKTKLTRTISR
jgi:hypothetical protein